MNELLINELILVFMILVFAVGMEIVIKEMLKDE